MRRPCILVSNDDGVEAPGIVALVAELVKADFAEIHVVAPAAEQSAKSHALTLGQHMIVEQKSVHPSQSCWAVHGTPADCVMCALSPEPMQTFLRVQDFDVVVSGINRGDNLGKHVLYSGTVGAAREAACKGRAAIAFSLDNHRATSPSDFAIAAQHSVTIVKAALGLLKSSQGSALPGELRGNVINVNFPFVASGQSISGFHLSHMSTACVVGRFTSAPHQEAEQALRTAGMEPGPSIRVMVNRNVTFDKDTTVGSDAWAVGQRYVSVTPLGLMQDYALSPEHLHKGQEFVSAVAAIVQDAATETGVDAAGVGVPKL